VHDHLNARPLLLAGPDALQENAAFHDL